MVLYAIKLTNENLFFKKTYRDYDFSAKDVVYNTKICSCEKLEDAYITSDKEFLDRKVNWLIEECNAELTVEEYKCDLVNEYKC